MFAEHTAFLELTSSQDEIQTNKDIHVYSHNAIFGNIMRAPVTSIASSEVFLSSKFSSSFRLRKKLTSLCCEAC